MIFSSNILSFYWLDQPGSTIRLQYKKYTSIFKDSVNFIRKLIRDVCFAFIFFYVVDLRFSASLSALAVIIFNLSFQMIEFRNDNYRNSPKLEMDQVFSNEFKHTKLARFKCCLVQ